MTAAPPLTCTCGHPESDHNARRPVGACTACTQCDGLLRDRPHDWHRCRCEAFVDAIAAEIRGDIEVLEARSPGPSPWAGHPIGLHSHTVEEPCTDECTFYPAPERSQP